MGDFDFINHLSQFFRNVIINGFEGIDGDGNDGKGGFEVVNDFGPDLGLGVSERMAGAKIMQLDIKTATSENEFVSGFFERAGLRRGGREFGMNEGSDKDSDFGDGGFDFVEEALDFGFLARQGFGWRK